MIDGVDLRREVCGMTDYLVRPRTVPFNLENTMWLSPDINPGTECPNPP